MANPKETEYYLGNTLITWDAISLEKYTKECFPPDWQDLLDHVCEEIIPIISKALQNYSRKNTIYPPLPLVYNCFDALKPTDIKVVIIGQDPYINQGEAMGWSFSVPDGKKVPPSLRNIYKELTAEGYTGYKTRNTGNLLPLVEKGVFLYNTCLTVNKGASASHKDLWEDFTNTVISYLNNHDNIAWILLGAKAQKYVKRLDKERHGIFTAGHPSPLNRNSDFAGSDIFKTAEKYLLSKGRYFSWNL